MRLAVICVLAALSACAVTKAPQPTHASRSDGIVELSYRHTNAQTPQVRWDEAQNKAAKSCRSWGFGGAERLGGERRECEAIYLQDGFTGAVGDCRVWRVVIPYQCVD